MDISIAGFFGNSPHRDLAYLKDFSQTIESLGFKSLSLPEHVIFFAKYLFEYFIGRINVSNCNTNMFYFLHISTPKNLYAFESLKFEF